MESFLYINLSYFTKKSVDQAFQIMNQYKDRPYLILDLRNSPGGYIDACMSFCRFLIKDKKEIVTLYYKNKKVTYYSDELALLSYGKIYVFVNEQTASCSEVTALTLKTNLKSVQLIGERTKGKECGQEIIVNKSKGFSMIVASFIWKCNTYGMEDLQWFIQNDVGANTHFATDDDYFKMALN
ncbi:S41 family peptidase [Paenibacillus sp. HW567]|uniref:S41 family peptidase n=1 Tax=Paenibacillus sp. HW567 TaxID=1034769 RepID=UPI0022B32F60|nr:S41 family peptidase [Paenibacillus sp. HW567]